MKETKGAFHLGKKPGNFGGSKSVISDGRVELSHFRLVKSCSIWS